MLVYFKSACLNHGSPGAFSLSDCSSKVQSARSSQFGKNESSVNEKRCIKRVSLHEVSRSREWAEIPIAKAFTKGSKGGDRGERWK